jgi:chemotaxis protein histidine kinase CheA
MSESHAASDVEPSREELLQRAEEAVAALADEYLVWTRSECQRVRDLHARGINEPGERVALQGKIFEAAHDLKGQGRCFGFDLVTDLGAMLCALLRNRDATTDDEWSVIGHHLEALEIVLMHSIRGSGGMLGAKLLNRLDHLSSASRSENEVEQG